MIHAYRQETVKKEREATQSSADDCLRKIVIIDMMLKITKGNYIADNNILFIVGYNAPYAERTIRECRKKGELLDITHNKASKSAIFPINGNVVVTAVALPTMISRINGEKDMNLTRITKECYVPAGNITAIMDYREEPSVRRKVQRMKETGGVRDMTRRKPTKSAVFMIDGTVILSPDATDTIVKHYGTIS